MTDEQLIARALTFYAERLNDAISTRMRQGEKGAEIARDESYRDRALELAKRGRE